MFGFSIPENKDSVAFISRHFPYQEATLFYERMVSESNLKPDAVSFANVVLAYASLANKRRIQSIHAFIRTIVSQDRTDLVPPKWYGSEDPDELNLQNNRTKNDDKVRKIVFCYFKKLEKQDYK